MTDLEERSRKLEGQIGGRDVFARLLTNADLARKDEVDDAVAELHRQLERLVGREDADGNVLDEGDIDRCDDDDERARLRGEARELKGTLRQLDARSLGLYVHGPGGEAFPDAELEATPIRMLQRLTTQATKYMLGLDEEERPTAGGTASS